jgi:hypothetical protein
VLVIDVMNFAVLGLFLNVITCMKFGCMGDGSFGSVEVNVSVDYSRRLMDSFLQLCEHCRTVGLAHIALKAPREFSTQLNKLIQSTLGPQTKTLM